jgi:hypothetical protein
MSDVFKSRMNLQAISQPPFKSRVAPVTQDVSWLEIA